MRQIFHHTAVLALLSYSSAKLQAFMQAFWFHFIEDLIFIWSSVSLVICFAQVSHISEFSSFFPSLFHSVEQNYHFWRTPVCSGKTTWALPLSLGCLLLPSCFLSVPISVKKLFQVAFTLVSNNFHILKYLYM